MSKLRKRSVNALHRLLADSVLQWQDPALSETLRRYALEHGAHHLHALGDHDGLWRMLRDETFRHTQIDTTGQYQAAYRALQHGLEAYAVSERTDPEDDARLCWMALRAGELAEEARLAIPAAFEWMRQRPLEDHRRAEDALERIAVLDEEGYYRAALLLLWIEADRLEALPERERTERWARRIVGAVEERIPTDSATIDWSKFLSVDFMAWLLGRLLATFQHLDVAPVAAHTSNANDYVTRLLEFRPQTDTIGAPLIRHIVQVVGRVKETHHKAETLAALAFGLSRSGDKPQAASVFDQALKLANAVQNNRCKAKTLASLGTALARSGDSRRAITVCTQAQAAAEAITDDRWKAEALAVVAQAVAETGQLHRALETAQSIEEEYRRAKAIGAIASIAAEHSDAAQTRRVCELILRAADVFTNARWQAETLAAVASAFAATGDTARAHRLCERALLLAEAVSNDYWASEIMVAICAALARTTQSPRTGKLFVHVRRLTDRMTDEHFQATTLTALASAIARTGQFAQALSMASVLPEGRSKATTLTAIAKICDPQRANSVLEQASQAAREIADDRNKDEALATVAAGMTQVGQVERALQLAAALVDRRLKVRALATMASRLALEGQVLRAREVFEQSILTAYEAAGSLNTGHTETLIAVASAFTRNGQFEKALQAAQQITHEGWQQKTRKAKALSAIASARARAGDAEQAEQVFAKALEVANAIDADYWKASTLAAIAVAVDETGHTEQARRIFEQSLQVADSIDDLHSKAECFEGIAKALARSARFDEALRVAGAIDDGHRQAETSAAVAAALASDGRAEDALKLADKILDPRFKAKALATVALALAKTGEIAAARRLCGTALQSAGQAGYACDALSAVAAVFAAAGEFKKALALAGQLTNDWHIRGTLVEIVLAVGRTGNARRAQSRIERIIRLADAIKDPVLRASTLAALGGTWTEIGDPTRGRQLVQRSIEVSQAIVRASDKAKSLGAIGHTLVKIGDPERFERLLHQLSSSQEVWNELLPVWRDSLRTGPADPFALLRKSLCHAAFSGPAAVDGALSLLLANIQARNAATWMGIIRACPQFRLDFLLDGSRKTNPR